MKNNITTYLLLIMFASFNVCNSSANEFLFNTTEINILDSGNVINATDGIAKSIKDNIEIEADKFEYIKNLSILNTSKGTLKATQDALEIKADKFQYNTSKSTIEAIGNVEIKNLKNNVIIQSEKIFYDSKNNFIESNTDSTFINNLGNFFKSESFVYNFTENILKVNNVKIQDNESNLFKLDKAFINLESNKLIGKDISIDFNNKSFLKDNEPRLSGVSVSADENQTIISKGIFTTCKRNDKCPPWKISAKEIKHNKKKQNNKLYRRLVKYLRPTNFIFP
tara:strand:- start:646 stop:1488 length:843 start_codon:yes stop_codon:yes gene_type:complete